MMKNNFSNELIHSSSPYLRQHAHNPVHWVEWSDNILEQARTEDKLILVSIGYSSCHWCHVMEKECFEKEDIAAIMNKHYICVKVDREERPDLDQVYMDALQLMTGQGGWPLNMFTLPDGRPLHGGTYFPKNNWAKLLVDLADYYQDNKEDAYAFATRLTQGIKNLNIFQPSASYTHSFDVLEKALQVNQKQFDLTWGAYQWAPKFPLPNHWDLYMQYHALSKQKVFKDATFVTLQQMMHGGIQDALAGGFCRYSTDSIWKVPHFEKMLYDNAQLMGTYALASQYLNHLPFAEVCQNIHRFLSAELKAPEGGWYAALDADSEGEEGLFYVWSKVELKEILDNYFPLLEAAFQITEEGNWEHRRNILHRVLSDEELAEKFKLTLSEVKQSMQTALKLLSLERTKRQRPGLDNKVICSWNALAIKGYAQASRFCQNPQWLELAVAEMKHLLSWSWQQNQLMRIKHHEGGRIHAFSDDYAHTADALLELFENTDNPYFAAQALLVTEKAIELFYNENNALFTTRSKHLPEIVTSKTDIHDDVIPCANSVMTKVLYKLSFYFNKPEWEEMALKMLEAVSPRIEKYPSGFSNWGQLILTIKHGFTQVIVTGPDAQQWKQQILQTAHFNTVCLILQKDSEIELFHSKTISHTENMAWICTHKTCGLPQQDLKAVLAALG